MSPELKEYLTKLFLMIKFPYSFLNSWLDDQRIVKPIADEIEYLNQEKPDLLEFKGEIEPPKLGFFLTLLNKAVSFFFPENRKVQLTAINFPNTLLIIVIL